MDPRLFEASLSGDTSALHSLLAQDPLIHDRVALNSVDNPLHVSSMAGHVEFTKEIVSQKPAFARELNEEGFSPLHIASANGHMKMVAEILRVGTDLCVLKGRDGKVPIHCAAMKGRVEVVRGLVLACPESIAQVTVRGESALHLAVKNNQFEVVKVLVEELKRLKRMEVVNFKDFEGNTVLHLATLRKQHETLELLLNGDESDDIAAVLDINSINSSGFTARDVLDFIHHQTGAESFEYKMVQKFQQAGALKSHEIITRRPTPAHQVQANKFDANPTPARSLRLMNLWRGMRKEIEDSSTENQDALMVVAVLIATMTYQSTLSPPSGFWSAESKTPSTSTISRRAVEAGEAVMGADPEVYALFTVFNAIGFFTSIGMISLLTSGFPLRAALRLAILSVTATYVIAIIYEAPTKMWTVFIVISMMAVLVLIECARFMLWLLRKLGLYPTSRERCFKDGNQVGV